MDDNQLRGETYLPSPWQDKAHLPAILQLLPSHLHFAKVLWGKPCHWAGFFTWHITPCRVQWKTEIFLTCWPAPTYSKFTGNSLECSWACELLKEAAVVARLPAWATSICWGRHGGLAPQQWQTGVPASLRWARSDLCHHTWSEARPHWKQKLHGQ